MALEISHITIEQAPNVNSITYVTVEQELNRPIIRYVTVEEPQGVLIVEVNLTDFLASLFPKSDLQISSAELYTSDLNEPNPYTLSFSANSLVANETYFRYSQEPDKIRMRFTISYTHPDSGNLVTETFEDFTPNI